MNLLAIWPRVSGILKAESFIIDSPSSLPKLCLQEKLRMSKDIPYFALFGMNEQLSVVPQNYKEEQQRGIILP